MTVEFFKEILAEPALKYYGFLRLDGEEIDAECLDLVMETANSYRDLEIMGTKVPEGYYHENAFKFNDVAYRHAEWVRLEHLFTLRDSFVITLEKHSLTGFDVNTFIKFWIESDHDMVQILKLERRKKFEPAILFDGIIVLVGRNVPFYLVAANTTKQRKYQIMGVGWFGNIIRMYSWEKDQPIKLGNRVFESFEPEYKVLMILNKKKELEEELEKIQSILETNQDQNVIKKKNAISRELQSVSVELDNYKLVLRDGIYRYT
ncbi:hypothetical protein CAEBREN_25683 [Caenorhabditis brenneri]|uniref:Sdz-33 F-box domain-containing protein n=1 Tax=Caenorhabditis brenneri TaxID=135651 RepID=G0MFC0_CAEBE|nr:hypothetical protein CAEBREN_25683 [Caenorhabditis brenneri]